ncbi:MAG: FAD-binding protein [Clostridia bacterium]|nr:FAD-binding protein [Clostridia bacterium]
MNNEYDIVIIGAGPAGSTIARFLDKKYKVLVVDRKSEFENQKNEKCCGGLLAPDAQKMLAVLGLGVPKSVLEDPQIFSVKTIDNNNQLIRYYQRYYINVNRDKFDRWLLSLVGSEVTISFDTLYKSHIEENDSLIVKLVKEKNEFTIKTRILIGADGAISKVRKNAFSSENPDMYISLQKWYKTTADMPYYISVFDKEITDFYSWAIKKDNCLLIGSAAENGKDANGKFTLLEGKLRAIGYDIGDEIKKEGTIILRTRKVKQLAFVNHHVALVGEAAGLISPSSAEGISYALKSGYYLAKAINEDINFKKGYLKSVRKLKVNIILKNMKIPFMYNNFLRKIVMKSGILSLK